MTPFVTVAIKSPSGESGPHPDTSPRWGPAPYPDAAEAIQKQLSKSLMTGRP